MKTRTLNEKTAISLPIYYNLTTIGRDIAKLGMHTL